MQSPFIYDPRFHTFDSWASLLVELYSAQNIEIPNKFTDWKKWGNGLKAIDIFTNQSLPSTDDYDNWFDWASEVVNSMQEVS